MGWRARRREREQAEQAGQGERLATTEERHDVTVQAGLAAAVSSVNGPGDPEDSED